MTIKTYLTNEEISAMIAATPFHRDKALLAFYADTGCRVSEAVALKVEHIDFVNSQVLIPHLKVGIRKKCSKCGFNAGRNQKYCAKCGTDLSGIQAEGIQERNRLITIGDYGLRLLTELVEGREPEDKVFNISRQWAYYVVRAAAEKIGLVGKCILNPETNQKHHVHPHNFRDSLAVSWLEVAGSNSNKQKALQEHLGHQSFGTTMRYNKLTPAAVKKVGDEVRRARFGEA